MKKKREKNMETMGKTLLLEQPFDSGLGFCDMQYQVLFNTWYNKKGLEKAT